MIELSEEDCAEICYSLETKHSAILRGECNSEREGDSPDQLAQQWAIHLRKIILKIGPEGRDLARCFNCACEDRSKKSNYLH